jgi:hypothetical protein
MSCAAVRILLRCARLLHEGRPFPVIVLVQRALRGGAVAPCSVHAGWLHLLEAQALASLGRPGAARAAACDGLWLVALHGRGEDVEGGAPAERP